MIDVVAGVVGVRCVLAIRWFLANGAYRSAPRGQMEIVQ